VEQNSVFPPPLTFPPSLEDRLSGFLPFTDSFLRTVTFCSTWVFLPFLSEARFFLEQRQPFPRHADPFKHSAPYSFCLFFSISQTLLSVGPFLLAAVCRCPFSVDYLRFFLLDFFPFWRGVALLLLRVCIGISCCTDLPFSPPLGRSHPD